MREVMPPIRLPEAIAPILAVRARLTTASAEERTEVFEELIQILEQTQFIFRFDWPQWIAQAQILTQQPERLKAGDLLTLRKLMTVYVRTHRFYNRYLQERWEAGQLEAIFERLSQLAN